MKPKAEAEVRDRPWGDPFNEFDPLAPLIPPEGIPEQLGYVSRRAQHLLGNRSVNEIDAGLETLTWMLQRAGSDIGSWNRSESEIEPRELFLVSPQPIKASINKYDYPERGHYYDTDFDRLCGCIDQYDISDQLDFPNAKKSDFFAILCLAFVSDVLRLAKLKIIVEERTLAYSPQLKFDEYYFSAIQSICHAENLITLKNIEKNVLSKRAKSAAKSRLPNFSLLRELCQKTFDELYRDSDISSLAAARNIYLNLSQEQIDTFITPDKEERIERIARWLRHHRKKYQ